MAMLLAPVPTGMDGTATVFVAASITTTSPADHLVAYTRPPSGDTASPAGFPPMSMGEPITTPVPTSMILRPVPSPT